MHVEELGRAAVDAHALALVELALAVVGRDALERARLGQAVIGGMSVFAVPFLLAGPLSWLR